MKKRVVITGMGVLAANGIGLDAFWKSLIECRSGIGLITRPEVIKMRGTIVGEIKGFKLSDHCSIPDKAARRMARHTQLAVAAARMAVDQAALTEEQLSLAAPIFVAMGTSTSDMDIAEKGGKILTERGPRGIGPLMMQASQPHAAATAVAESIGVPIRAITYATACTAGLDAMSSAAAAIEQGISEMAIAGGTGAQLNDLTLSGFHASGLSPVWNGPPETASRPFDRDRAGGIIAEGAAVFVLESRDHALARGALHLLEICGYSFSLALTSEDQKSGYVAAMRGALADARLMPQDIGYISAHGPSDVLLDAAESEAIKEVFGKHAYRIPVSSIKGVTGNPLSAGGPLQVASCALAVRDGLIPPTANWEHLDPACDLDYVPGHPRRASFRFVLVNSHGVGGGCSSLVVEAHQQ